MNSVESDLPVEKARKGRKVDTISRAEKAHLPVRRKALGVGYNVEYPEHLKDKNYYYYFAADQGGNIQRRLDAGYEFVVNEDGKKVERNGKDGVTLFLLRQPMEYREEDLALQRQENYDIVKAEQSLSQGEYIPGDRKNVIQRDDMLDPLA